MGTLGILVFPSPIQHRLPAIGLGLARSASQLGHQVTVFFLGDGVYCTSRALQAAGSDSVVTHYAQLPRSVALINCSTCARFRGLADGDLIPNARNGTLEDLADLLTGADRFIALTQEG